MDTDAARAFSAAGTGTADPFVSYRWPWCDPTFTEQFHGWAASLIDVATDRYGIPAENVTYLGEKVEIAPELIADRSTRNNVAAAIQVIADQSAPADHVAIVFFGHGSFTDVARLNLPGRDPSADDFAGFLDALGDRRVTFVNTASASGPFVEALSAEGRVIMTATKTGRQWNAAVLGYFVEAFTGEERLTKIKTSGFPCLKLLRMPV
ncbi:MAG: hypothetical protein Ct9H300mP25_00420 [Acidobacteriota bacterium]|nr:MAG: hypothetical protein Ct9H300mP25_00420 [Acidobacteriota bacterium]